MDPKSTTGQIHFTRKKFAVQLAALAVCDAAFGLVACLLALLMRFDFSIASIEAPYLDNLLSETPLGILVVWAVAAACGLYRYGVAHKAGARELERIIVAAALISIIQYAYMKLAVLEMPRSYYVMSGCLFVVAFGISRYAPRIWWRVVDFIRSRRSAPEGAENVMVIGAGEAGEMIIRELLTTREIDSRVRCVIDDEPGKVGQRVLHVPIVGTRRDIPSAVEQYEIDSILLAIPTLSPKERKEILDICESTGKTVRILPGLYQLIVGDVAVADLRDVEIEDLLGREPVETDIEEVLASIAGKTVLVTGAGGSIGSEISRQIASHQPGCLVILDIYENTLYDLQRELLHDYPELDLVTLVASVRDEAKMRTVLAEYQPHIVYHAAAHKHVPLMETSPNEAVKNNVFGTLATARAADAAGVAKFVLISTDKAVNPTSMMGATKRICEMVVQMMDRTSATNFVAVRFGNVLGSNGSVVPVFKKQIAAGGPVTVTDPDVVRYFMTIPEAVALVLQAGAYAKGGEIFVLDMGDPVKIDDLARNLIRLSGLLPDVDIDVVYTGLRPGEKLYEEMLMSEEGLTSTPNHLIFIGSPITMDDARFLEQLGELRSACMENSGMIRECVARIAPTYHPVDNG